MGSMADGSGGDARDEDGVGLGHDNPAVPPVEELEEKLSDVLDQVPDPARREIRQLFLAFARYQGPLPPPRMFRDYEEVLPGATDRIFSMAEKEQSHRHRWEADALRADRWYRMAGLSAGWTVALGLAAAAAACGIWGDWRVGCALAATSATTMVWKLVQGRSQDDDEPPAQQAPRSLTGSDFVPETGLDHRG